MHNSLYKIKGNSPYIKVIHISTMGYPHMNRWKSGNLEKFVQGTQRFLKKVGK